MNIDMVFTVYRINSCSQYQRHAWCKTWYMLANGMDILFAGPLAELEMRDSWIKFPLSSIPSCLKLHS